MPQNLSVGKKGLYLSLVFSLGSLAVILALTVDERTLGSLLQLRPVYLAAALLMVVLFWLAEGLRIKSIAAALGYEGSLPVLTAVRIYLVTFFFAGITPLAIGEWPAQIYVLCKSGLTAGESAAISLVRTFLTKCFFVLLAAFLLYTDRVSGSGIVFRFFRVAFWVMILSTALYLVMLWQSGLAQSVLSRLMRYKRFSALYRSKPRVRSFFSKLMDEAVQFQETVSRINFKNSILFIPPVLLTVVFWGIFYSIAPVLLYGLGIAPDVRAVLTWQVIILLIIPYVPVPGGSGVAELGLATLFAAFVPGHILGVFIVAWRFFTYYITLICGGVTTFGVRR